MIPETQIAKDFEFEQQPSLTHKIDFKQNMISGFTDELDAVHQTIYMILNTERYQYVIYSWDYGIELADLCGEPVTYVCPELERRINEALTQDERILSTDNFSFDVSKKGKVHVAFVVNTIFGNTEIEREVSV